MALFDADARQAVLRALPPAYYQKSFNSVHAELAALKGGFHPDRLEEVIESRTSMLEVMSEMLAAHVLSHYDKFLEGVKSVATFERELQRSVSLIKQARGELQAELAYVDAGYAIITQTAARGRLLEMLDMLSTLDAVRSLPTTIKDASFGRALWLCAQAWKALEALPQAAATLALQATITSQYEATAAALQSSLRAVCGDFQPGLYSNVLDGHRFLGSLPTLGADISACFGDVVGDATLRAVQSVLSGKPSGNGQHGASQTPPPASMHDAARLLPPELFKAALSRVLEAIFDVLVSHLRMVRWHEEAMSRHQAELARLQPQLGQLQGSMPPGAQSLISDGAQQHNGGIPGAAAIQPGADGGGQPHEAAAPAATAAAATAMLPAAPPPEQDRASVAADQGPDQAATAAAAEEQAWGDALVAIHGGLLAGRRFIWEEASRKIGILALSPQALRPEHLVQVLSWVSEALALGEAFSGDDSRQLRAALSGAAQEAFSSFHAALLQRLQTALGRESWRRADVDVAGLPNLGAVLQPPRKASTSGGLSAFEKLATGGNPWRQQKPRSRSKLSAETASAAAARIQDASATPVAASAPAVVAKASRGSAIAVAADATGKGRDAGKGSKVADSSGGHLIAQQFVQKPAVPDQQQPNASAAVKDDGSSDIAASWGSGQRRGGNDSSIAAALASKVSSSDGGGSRDSKKVLQGNLCAVARAQHAADPTRADTRHQQQPPVVLTATAMQLVLRMRDYCELLRVLQPVPYVFDGLCALFELFLLHVVVTFSGARLAELISDRPMTRGSAEDAVPQRLRRLLTRICAEPWLEPFRGTYVQSGRLFTASRPTADVPAAAPRPPGASASRESISLAGNDAALQRIRAEVPGFKSFGGSGSFTSGMAGGDTRRETEGTQWAVERSAKSAGAAAQPASGRHSRPTVAMASTGGWGLAERFVAVGALSAVAGLLRGAKSMLPRLLPATADPQAIDRFFSRTVDAAEDVQDAIMRAGARSALQLSELGDDIAATDYNLQEVPDGASPWVAEANHEIGALAARITAVGNTQPSSVTARVWRHAAAYLAEVVLTGFTRVRAKGTAAGRGAMAADLAELSAALKAAAPRDAAVAAAMEGQLRLVDSWIRAFYIDTDAELLRWVGMHPEYSAEALAALANAIADYQGLLKAKRAALLERVAAAAASNVV